MKENIKTLLLSLLLGVTILMIGLVWMRVPTNTEQILVREKESPDISEELQRRFYPQKAIINFGAGEHTVVRRIENLWPFYVNILKESFFKEEESVGEWKEISEEEYFNLHQEPSIAFDLENEIYSHLFVETFYLKKEDLDMGEKVKQVYFSANGDKMILVTNQGYFKYGLSDVSSQGMEKYLISLKNESNYTPYKSFWELYGVDNLVYIPQIPLKENFQKVYQNDLTYLTPAYESDLVQRFLNQSLDDVHPISEEDSRVYVSGQKNLRIYKEGYISYQDSAEKRKEEPNLTKSIEVATNFIVEKTGLANEFYIDTVSEVEKNGRSGYHLEVNYLENSLPVIPLNKKDPYSYIKMDLIDNNVENFFYLYRTASEEPTIKKDDKEMMAIEEILSQNLDEVAFKIGRPGGEYLDVIKKIEDINICLLDQVEGKSNPLIYGYEVNFNGKRIYFSGETGEILMER